MYLIRYRLTMTAAQAFYTSPALSVYNVALSKRGEALLSKLVSMEIIPYYSPHLATFLEPLFTFMSNVKRT